MNLKVFIKLFKIFVAGMISLVILSAFSLLYYNNGIRKTCTTGATDYSWENRIYSLGYEGYALGMYDEAGYNNSEIPTNGEADKREIYEYMSKELELNILNSRRAKEQYFSLDKGKRDE